VPHGDFKPAILIATRVVAGKNEVRHLEDSEPDPVFRLGFVLETALVNQV
jgi:hypothetical protein